MGLDPSIVGSIGRSWQTTGSWLPFAAVTFVQVDPALRRYKADVSIRGNVDQPLAIAQALRYAEELRELYGAERLQRRCAEHSLTRLEDSYGTTVRAPATALDLRDDMMVTPSGWLAQQLVALQPEMKILYVSGYAGDTIAGQGMLKSGFAFLPKPLTPNSLAHKVREVLDTPKPLRLKAV